jgi:hemerythrin-like domain-containing protein
MEPGTTVGVETIAALSAEHVAVRELLERASRHLALGDEESGAQALLASQGLLRAGLDEHIRVEDEELFPAISDELGSGLVAVFGEEHVRIRALRDEVMASLSRTPLSATAFEELADLLESHTRREDEVLFPAAQNLLAERSRR